MHPGRASVLLAFLLAGCAHHPPLGVIEPIPGSRSREGGTIVPIDSAHRIRRVNGETPTHEIRRLSDTATATLPQMTRVTDSGATGYQTIRPLDGAARTPTAHDVVPLDRTVVPVDGTSWVGRYVEGDITFEFLVGGFLRYTTETGVYTNGTWQQHSNSITFEMNDHYAEYTGEINGPRMSGTAHNREGRRWAWEATRQ